MYELLERAQFFNRCQIVIHRNRPTIVIIEKIGGSLFLKGLGGFKLFRAIRFDFLESFHPIEIFFDAELVVAGDVVFDAKPAEVLCKCMGS